MTNLCLASCCNVLTADDALCAKHDQLFTDGLKHARMVTFCDVFQRAITGFHTLAHIGLTARNLGTGGDTADRWEAFGA